jgi:hypothetical protein
MAGSCSPLLLAILPDAAPKRMTQRVGSVFSVWNSPLGSD